jgi:hypothetical protein
MTQTCDFRDLFAENGRRKAGPVPRFFVLLSIIAPFVLRQMQCVMAVDFDGIKYMGLKKHGFRARA